ncbi:peptidase S41 [Mycoplasmopsis agalactiae]|nr:S41 family peptidase [Mycoplasmopsis agalactiae]MCE6091173.1 peptidase S41 [Mycoplasmopsis agalactiae]
MKKSFGFLATTIFTAPLISCNNQEINITNANSREVEDKKIISHPKKTHTNIVYFIDNKLVKEVKIDANSVINFETIQKPGYKFAGYFFDKDFKSPIPNDYIADSDLNIYLKYIPNFTKSTYELNSITKTILPTTNSVDFYELNDINYISVDDFLKISDGILDFEQNYYDVSYQSKSYDLQKKITSFYDNDTFTINSINKFNSSDGNMPFEQNYTLKFDYQNQQIVLSSYEFLNSILPREHQQSLLFEIKDEKISDDKPVVIDLRKYGLEMIKHEGKILIPFNVINQVILSESVNQFYFNNDKVVIFNFYELHNPENLEYRQKLSSANLNKKVMSEDLKEYQFNFFHFLLDNFYGIKNKDPNWPLNFLNKYKQGLLDSDEKHYKTVHSVINGLDDLHTKLFMNGYNQDERQYDDLNNSFDDTKRIKEYWKLYFSFQKMSPRNGINFVTPDNKTLIVRFDALIDGITSVLESVFEEYKSKDVKNVVLDFSNMLGGSLYAVYELLGFITDKEFDYNLINPQSGSKNAMKVKSKTYKKDFKFYLLTSPITYSSGNLFAGIVKDNNLAKIIGYKTQGGASYLKMSVLPTGNIAVLSSNNVFANKNFESYEYGVDPDIEFPKNSDGSNDYSKLFDVSYIQEIVNKN